MRGQDRLAGGNLRKSIRLLKYLRDYKQTFTVPSVILTGIVGGRVSWWQSRLWDGYADLPTAFTRLLTDTDHWLQQRPDLPEISDPSCPQARFDHRLTSRDTGTSATGSTGTPRGSAPHMTPAGVRTASCCGGRFSATSSRPRRSGSPWPRAGGDTKPPGTGA